MARKPQLPQNQAELTTDAPLPAMATVDPVFLPLGLAPDGPKIEYFGEGAEKVPFTVNPLAERYVVYANGIVMEYLR